MVYANVSIRADTWILIAESIGKLLRMRDPETALSGQVVRQPGVCMKHWLGRTTT